MFTVGGKNTYPAEIEGALLAHPGVQSALVVGVPHEDLGQVPYALVQPVPGAGVDEVAVREFVAERLEAHKVPRTIEFVDHPLRDEAGKARRTAVRDEVIARRQAPANR
jgi:bile acid-coenzyme A ligase